AHLPNLSSYCPDGKYLSLIYIHPMIAKTPREDWDSDDLWGTDSATGADRNRVSRDDDQSLMQLLMVIDGANMRKVLPAGVVDLLDSVKGIKRIYD
ncbi:hypothetical protein DFQ28_010939, partial [Apophysomyces sp. BC1034]